MKLSDAILLGTVTIPHLQAGVLSGCALGMAANAVDIHKDYAELEERWPWLRGPKQPICQCSVCGDECMYIAHLFDTHIMDNGTMTLEQLVDYVRSIEPPDVSEPDAEQMRLEEIDAERESSGGDDPNAMEHSQHGYGVPGWAK